MDDFGNYRGGVPSEGNAARRGTALGIPGTFHDPLIHNHLEYDHQDTHRVTQEEALKFKNWMTQDKIDFERSVPYYPMYYDREHKYMKERRFWLLMIIAITGSSYLYKKLQVENDRYLQWQRKEKLHKMPAHHFNNRGGVLFEKEFIGFEKYYKSGEDVTNWYRKAYPHMFQNEATAEAPAH